MQSQTCDKNQGETVFSANKKRMGGTKCCCGQRLRRTSEESLSSEADYETDNKKKWPLWKKLLVWSIVVLFILIFLVFILVWVVVPIVFWLSIAFQRLMIFIPFASPKNPDFDHPENYGITGVKNFYISVRDYYDNNTVTQIGAWLILPEEDKDSVALEDIPAVIAETKYDIVLYLHGVYENRAKAISKYGVLREKFLVISIDHRGYGDSGKGVEMSEEGIVSDHLQIYEWVMRMNFKNNIYYWGHSLGAALSCHTLRALKEQKNVVPKGLILESAFSTLTEEVINSVIGKVFRWLAYFNSTVVNPLDDNGFHFYSTTNIKSVDCPIMMLHAEDDNVIPYTLGSKLANVAKTERDLEKQGNVTFHLFSSELGYGHNDITKDPNIPQYITSFKETCESFVRPS